MSLSPRAKGKKPASADATLIRTPFSEVEGHKVVFLDNSPLTKARLERAHARGEILFIRTFGRWAKGRHNGY